MGETDQPDQDPGTVFIPSPPPEPTGSPSRDRPAGGGVAVGDVLNGIYEVKRLIGRGGMGEVYEGVNVNSDERVAIKVMLPTLAADPNVQAMFRKEARTLTRLAHPALVQYRVLASEPRLGVLYIVTEFVDGVDLSEVLGRIAPSSAELRGLARRLAEGLRAAHELGAVHRDVSPDNVRLPDGRLDRAKIMDFGIAKDMESKATIIGDGFAGKLGYVAPEQFGDFDRQIGPWTDVYSLALVILAVAQGRNVDMGSTLVEAVDRRRAGVDLSAAPEDLRPLLQAMLVADPARRLRSMDEVLEMLGPAGGGTGRAPGAATGPPAAGPPAAKRSATVSPTMIGGGVAFALAVGIAIFLVLPRGPPKPGPGTSLRPSAASAPMTLSQAVEAALPNLACSWLDLANPAAGGSVVRLVGVAGSLPTVQSAVIEAAKGAGVALPDSDVDLDEVAPADQPMCPALDAFRSVRAAPSASGPVLSTAQRVYTIARQPDGKLESRAVVTMAIRNPSDDFALLGLEPSGKITMVIPSRQAFDASRANNDLITSQGGDTYQLQINAFDFHGWAGLLLLTGRGPFDPALLAAPPDTRDVAWFDKVRQAAAAGGWKAQMVWYKVEAAGRPPA